MEFLGFVPDDALPKLYTNAEAFFFPQYEDAGIVLLEAQAAGTPVIAYNAGGAKDMVIEGQTGIFFNEQSLSSLREALERFRSHSWNRDAICTHAQKFSQEIFQERILAEVQTSYENFRKGTFERV